MNDNDVQHGRELDNTKKFAALAIRDLGREFMQAIDERVPRGREADIAKDKIEEAVVWAVKGITR